VHGDAKLCQSALALTAVRHAALRQACPLALSSMHSVLPAFPAAGRMFKNCPNPLETLSKLCAGEGNFS